MARPDKSAIGRVAEYGARADTEWQCSSEPTACPGLVIIKLGLPIDQTVLLLATGYGYG